MEINSVLFSTVFSICCALGARGDLAFTVVGDWGGQTSNPYTTPAECSISEQMGVRAQMIGSQFTVALGDNFYVDGVKDVDDPRFKETYEVSYLHPPLLRCVFGL